MRAEFRKHWRGPIKTKLRSFQYKRAIKQRFFRKSRKETWQNFINSLNIRTPTKKVCDKLKKFNGKDVKRYKP